MASSREIPATDCPAWAISLMLLISGMLSTSLDPPQSALVRRQGILD